MSNLEVIGLSAAVLAGGVVARRLLATQLYTRLSEHDLPIVIDAGAALLTLVGIVGGLVTENYALSAGCLGYLGTTIHDIKQGLSAPDES